MIRIFRDGLTVADETSCEPGRGGTAEGFGDGWHTCSSAEKSVKQMLHDAPEIRDSLR
jgi:hypothetical protein